MISEELPDQPLFQTLDSLSRVTHCASPPMEITRSAILNAGYRVSYSHANKNSIKTDAPNEFLWDMMRHWVKTHPIKSTRPDNDPGNMILSKEPSAQVSFEVHENAQPVSKSKQMVRYQRNPEPNWGPKSRPNDASLEESQIKLKKLKVVKDVS